MGNNGKSLRDALLSGGPAGMITALLVQHGVDAVTAVATGTFCAGVITRAWRLLRTRYPVLGQIVGDETAQP